MSTPNDIQALLASIRPRPSPTSMTGYGYGHGPDAPNAAAPSQPPQYPPQYTAGFPRQQQPIREQAFPFAASPHLRQQQQQQQQQLQGVATGYRHPSVSTLHSPMPLHNSPPHRGSDILSPNVSSTPRGDMFPEQNPDRAVNLLSLLKSNQGAAAAATATSPAPVQQQSPAMPLLPQDQETGLEDEAARQSHAKNISASDLVASLLGGDGDGGGGRQAPTGPALAQQPAAVPARFPYEQPPGSSVGVGESPSSATPNLEKEMLLRLLNRSHLPQDVGGDGPGPAKPKSQSPSSASPAKSPIAEPFMSGARQLEEITSGKPDVAPPNAPTSIQSKESLFTYVNPFEQLAAVSPRNRTPQPKSRSASPAVDLLKNQNLNLAAKMEPPAATVPDAAMPSQLERSESPVLEDEQREAISDVVGQMVEQIGREIDGAPRKSVEEESPVPPVSVAREESTQEVLSSIADNLRETVPEAKQEPVEETAEEFIQEGVTATTTATAVPVKKTTKSKKNGEALPDNWELSAEDTAAKEDERVVYVYNFPLKPFISIVVRPNTGKLANLRDDGIMDIARLKKEFDQLDRSLTSATSEYIVYALAKNGGMRIIRQDDGSDKQVFRSTRDRVFNVALSTSQPTAGGALEEQAILGIGVSGTVYWALISRPEKDLFELDALESESLVFPPFPASDENTSGGQLKTRAKRSSRHPGFFAIGRGKNIYVISPHAAMNPAYGVSGTQRMVNTEKFFKERALKISTGKAGKDFMFSDDDTVIASLDKTGRLRFWDVRDVANNEFFTNNSNPAEVRVALSTFVTGSPTEKSWPTSVLFIDKLRPYVKSIALRYVLVGLKQNHTLQLWDIGLGKAVQELNFPHENESDAICSVAYHAASGIIVVGHPTRNSIYFVHLSAPRYMLPSMSQASFIKRASEKDTSLPKPESTACMSGIREISFASKGQLRSLDLLPINKGAAAGDKRGLDEDSGLFELYVMHSRGVTCLNIQKEDLGWSADNKIMHPINALGESLIDINELETFPAPATDVEPSINGDTSSTPTKVAPKEAAAKKASEVAAEAAASGPSRTQSPTKPALKKKSEEPVEPVATAVPTNGSEKPEKKKKRKGTGASAAAGGEGAPKVKDVAFTETPSELPRGVPTQKTTGEQPNGSESHQQPISAATPGVLPSGATSIGGGSNEYWNKHMETLQSGVSNEFNRTLGREIEGLYTRFDEERQKWDNDSRTKQDQVLRLVSSTLSDNVEKNLARIVSNSIQTEVVPALLDGTSKQLNDVVARQLGGIIPREVHQALPEAVSRAVQQPEVMKVVSEAVAQKLGSQVEGEVSKALHTTINPAVKNLTLRAAEKVGADMERQVQAQMKQLEVQRHNDSAKIDQLTTLVRGLSDTVAAMAATQTGFQNEVLRLNHALNARQGVEGHQSVRPPAAAAPTSPVEARIAGTAEDIELAELAQLMKQGQYEEGSVKWLQSSQQADLFDNLFVRLNPSYLTGLSPIVELSVGVAVTSSLETNTMERLAWLEVVLHTVDLRDPDIREVAPRIMDILTQRLEALYLTVAQNNPHDPIVRRIAPLSRRARELRGV